MPSPLLLRLSLAAVLLLAELLALTASFDGFNLPSSDVMVRWILASGILRFSVACLGILITFAFLARFPQLKSWATNTSPGPFRPLWLLTHLASSTLLVLLIQRLYQGESVLLIAACFVALAFALLSLALAILPLDTWTQLNAILGSLWLYSALAAALAALSVPILWNLWKPASYLTFALVRWMLLPFFPGLRVKPDLLILGTRQFAIQIEPGCSGLEGIGLLLVFGSLFLWLFRKECRFPQAFLLLPFGVVTLFLLNAIRIAGLFVIGQAGAQQIAVQGFHSQAGWISFNLVAFGLCFAATRSPWITHQPATPPPPAHATHNPVAPYLMPFLLLLGVGMLTTASSAGFEWLYPVRTLAVAAALIYFRSNYKPLLQPRDFTPIGPLAGIVVFLLWIASERLLGTPNSPMPAELQAASEPLRLAWILARASTTILLVPLAEELAFRAYLLRRFVDEDFESLPLTRFTWVGLAASSLVFGSLHGSRWIVGTLAGLIFAYTQVRRGSFGDAFLAHLLANVLVTAYVLLAGAWQLW